jgi:DNA-binding NarL/FixJ family response regulator
MVLPRLPIELSRFLFPTSWGEASQGGARHVSCRLSSLVMTTNTNPLPLAPTVLLADSSDILRLFTVRQLELAFPRIKFVTARSCREARELAGSLHPALLILQRCLPDGSGVGLLSELSRLGLASACIVIGRESDRRLCDDGGAAAISAVLPEPYETKDLVALVRQVLLDTAGNHDDRGFFMAAVSAGNPRPSQRLDTNSVINGLASLVAGLRAFEAELRASLSDPQAVQAVVNENIELLAGAARELATTLKHMHEGESGELSAS